MNKIFALAIAVIALTGLTAWKCEYNPTFNQPAPATDEVKTDEVK